jgi:NAD-dependent DNA ligase
VDLVAFEILEGELAGAPQLKQLAALDSLGFNVVEYDVVRMPMTSEQLEQLLAETMSESKYELDGIVMTKNVSYTASETNPEHAFKFKMNADEDTVLVTCTHVTYQKTMHGYLNPVVHFDPTMIGGVMVSKTNGHNGYYIEHGYLYDKKVTNPPKAKPIGPGAILKMVRSGKVIPYILDVVKGARKPQLPDVDYEVGGVEFVLSETEDTAVAVRKMTHFLSRLKIEEVAGGKLAKIFFTNYAPKHKMKNREFWGFTACREFKRAVATSY